MAYCRWSSDDFQCDVYTFEDVAGGYTTYVASRRRVFFDPLPEPVEWDPDNLDLWFQRHAIVMERVNRSELVDIGGPHDGASFNDPTPGACADRLEMLREAGYRVPQYAIDSLREEAREEQSA